MDWRGESFGWLLLLIKLCEESHLIQYNIYLTHQNSEDSTRLIDSTVSIINSNNIDSNNSSSNNKNYNNNNTIATAT
mgnify:CR=1 FL=1